MVDFIIKVGLFCAAPALLDLFVYKATGAPLHESVWWWLRNIGDSPKFIFVLILGFGLLALLVFAGFAYGVSKDFYQSLISRPHTALFLGFHSHQEHYLLEGGGDKRAVSINHPGPGVSRLDNVYQPATIMYNPLSQLYWPLKETRNTGLFAFLTAIMLIFVLAPLGEMHILYMDKLLPGLLQKIHPEGGDLYEGHIVPIFMKALYAYFVSNKTPFILLIGTIILGLTLQSQRLKSESGNLTMRQVPAAIKPGAVLTATLADTYLEHLTSSSNKGSYERQRKFNYSAIFEISGIYPHPVWVSAYLGSDFPNDKDDGVYPTLDNELDRRTDYENAQPLFEKLEQLKASRPQMQVGVTQNLTLDWTVEPSLILQQAN